MTGARLAALIRSLAEAVEVVEDTGEAVGAAGVGDSVEVVAISDIGLITLRSLGLLA